MGDAIFAVCYVVFAVLSCWMSMEVLNTSQLAKMYTTVMDPFMNRPFGGGDGTAPTYFENVASSSELAYWLRGVFTEVTFDEQQAWDPDSPWNDIVEWNDTLTPATVGSFNRVMLVRFTTKRWALQDTQFGAFDEVTLKRIGSSITTQLDPSSTDSTYEEQSDICIDTSTNGTNSSRCYAYHYEGSYREAGGYVFVLNPMDGKEAFQKQVDQLMDDGFFDMRMGSFVVDMLVYNHDVKLFLKLSWVFIFDFAGNCHKKKHAQGFSLYFADMTSDENMALFVVFMLILCMLCMFLLVEIRKICDIGFLQHFRKMGAVIDAVQMLTCALTLASFTEISSQSIMQNFEFEDLMDPSMQVAKYAALENLAVSFEVLAYLSGVNLLVVFVRALFLLATLQSNLGIMFKVVDQCFHNLAAFAGMFLMCQMTFNVMAYFTFGSRFEDMSEPKISFYRCFSMMTGKPIYNELYHADPLMGPIFYFVFYIFFYLVMVNMFVSILLNGYDFVDNEIHLKKRGAEKETSILVKLYEELRQDVFGRFWRVFSVGLSCAQFFVTPLVGCAKECLECCPLPSLHRPAFIDRMTRPRTDSDDHEFEEPDDTADQATKAEHQAAKHGCLHTYGECLLMVFFMANFVIFAQILTRGEVQFSLSQATLDDPINSVSWEDTGSVEDYGNIRSFEDVEKWASAFLEDVYKNTLCAVYENGLGFIKPLELVNNCANSDNTQQLVQRVSNWNTGFLNTTFVRLTVTPACYVSNPLAKWAAAAPVIRKTSKDKECGRDGCAQVLQENACMTYDGMDLNLNGIDSHYVESTVGTPNPVKYNYSNPLTELGSHQMLGGFVFSFGTTEAEFREKMNHVRDGRWFTKNSASMVFDWITYNGNVDMFTYSTVSFSLLGTGEMVKTSKTQSFPLNIFMGGGDYLFWRIVNLANFSIYVLLVLYCICKYISDMHKDLKRLKFNFKKFVREFFSNTWHLSDLISLCLSIVAIILLVSFAVGSFRRDYKFSVDSATKYQIPNTDVTLYNMSKGVDPSRNFEDDMYIMLQFEELSNAWATCLLVNALNSFFISIKVVKYYGSMKRVQPFSFTLHHGRERNLNFAFAMLMGMIGFSFFLHTIFGHMVPGFETTTETLLTIFKWVIGEYDLKDLFEVNFMFSLICFVLFMVTFYFIFVNMFLATMLNTFSETVGALDIKMTKAAVERSRPVRMVDYPTKTEFLEDVVLELDEDEFVVASVQAHGRAQKKGVQKGHIIYKVNREKDAWRKPTLEETRDYGICEDERRGHVSIVFKEKTEKGLMGMITMTTQAMENVRPTVRNFWGTQGVVSFIGRDVASSMRGEQQEVEEEACEGGDKKEEDAEDKEEDAVGAEDSAFAANTGKANRTKIKKKLDSLLFSRWIDGKRQQGRDGAATTPGKFWLEPGEDLGNQEEVEEENDVFEADFWDLGDLRDNIEGQDLSGQEAWLDCLVTSMEREMAEDESIISDLLRTSNMQELGAQYGGDQSAMANSQPLQNFYKNASDVLKILENKAQTKYFQQLRLESEDRQDKLRRQNSVLHEYICELERKFTEVTEDIQDHRAKKTAMYKKLAMAMDNKEYNALDRRAAAAGAASSSGDGAGGAGLGGIIGGIADHLKNLTMPWPAASIGASASRQEGVPPPAPPPQR